MNTMNDIKLRWYYKIKHCLDTHWSLEVLISSGVESTVFKCLRAHYNMLLQSLRTWTVTGRPTICILIMVLDMHRGILIKIIQVIGRIDLQHACKMYNNGIIHPKCKRIGRLVETTLPYSLYVHNKHILSTYVGSL